MTTESVAVRWSHVGLNCYDVDATEGFYRTWFGFERARVVGDGADRIVFLRKAEAYLELFGSAGGTRGAAAADGPHSPGLIRHLAFQVDDLDAFVERLKDNVTVTLGPLRFDEVIDGWRTIWVSDPDGVVVEVSQGYHDQDPAAIS